MKQIIDHDQLFSLTVEEKDFIQSYLVQKGFDPTEMFLNIGQMIDFIKMFAPTEITLIIRNVFSKESTTNKTEHWMIELVPTLTPTPINPIQEFEPQIFTSTELVDCLWLAVKYYIIRNLKNYQQIEL